MRPSPLLPILAALVLPLPAQAPVTRAEFTEAIAWFDTLGYPDVADRPFVTASTGSWSQHGNEPKRPDLVSGFLLADEGEQFTLLTIGLDERTFARTPAGTEPLQRVSYTVESLPEAARRALQEVRNRDAVAALHADGSWNGPPAASFPVSLFFLARTVNAAGQTDLALELAEAARRSFRQGTVGQLQDLLARDLAHQAMWRLIVGFGDRERSFADLLADCERFLQRYPDSEHVERAERTRDLLRRMLREEAARPPVAEEAGEADRPGHLVFALRDQNGQQWCQPGECDVFADPRQEASPAHRLVDCGYRAVPFLLPAFDDDSFTRCVEFHRNFYFSHEVLRVREVAAAVFERITGSRATDRAGAERIWRQLEQRGERAVLLEGAAQGNLEQARRLVLRYPDAALEPLRQAMANAHQRWQRERVLGLLSGLPGEAATELLRAALRPAGDAPPSVTAAIALCLRDERDAATDAMIAAWQRGVEGHEADQVAGFLATCGARRAIAALAATPARLDDDAIRTLGHGHAWLPSAMLPDGSGSMSSLPPREPEEGTAAAIERLLAGLLVDERRLRGNFGGTIDPEVRDFAAQALSERWPERYAFDFGAPREDRLRQGRAVANAWRTRQGLEPLAAPGSPRIPTVDAAVLAELVTDARLESSAVARRAILDRIEALGLGALATVRERLAAVRDPLRRQEWQALASRIASRVREVRLAEGSAPFPRAIEDLAVALRGRRLDPDALADLLAALGQDDAELPAATTLRVTRAGDGTGVLVEFVFAGAGRGSGKGVQYRAAVTSGRRGLCGTTGAGIRSVAGERSHYAEFAEAIAAGLAAPADVPLDASYELRFE